MEWHIKCDPDQISRYVFCPGDHSRARKIAEQMEEATLVSDSRGYVVYSGTYKGVFMTVCGTGMGGPTVAIALEELAHMGADTFIRVGSCGVFQEGQKPGDVIIVSGTVRKGGTANNYLPAIYPAVPTYAVLRALVDAAEAMDTAYTVGVGVSGDAFYAPFDVKVGELITSAGVVAVEMESDTLFIVGAYRGWRTGAAYASDGAPGVIKPDWGEADFRRGEMEVIKIGLEGMLTVARADERG